MTEKTTEIINEAAEIVESELDPPMSMEEFIDEVVNNPEYACSAPEYLLRAIEHFGTRTVTESGEEVERWEFFDDPANNGEHAILGNTDILNEFVEGIRGMARGPSNEEKMFWFEGPTATGKSEFKRCLINGIRAFSKTDEGKRFTVEWNLQNRTGSGMTYGDDYETNDENWYESPVQMNPLSVLPEETRRSILYDDSDDEDVWLPPDIEPFSEEAYDALWKRYDGDFEDIINESHCRVVRYHLDVGRGIGVLQAEDIGDPRQKLVGQWMPGMVKELDSRGRRNPQALSYDGVLSQGNSGLTIIEDAVHHFQTIIKMLSVPEDDEVKIDRRETMPIDTVSVIISNPDAVNELMDKAADVENDSFRPVRRRLDKYTIPYIVTPTIEAELLHRQLKGYEAVWKDEDRISDAVILDGVEVAPHGLEAAAYYDVVTRLVPPDVDVSHVQKAKLYDGRELDVEYTTDDIDEGERFADGLSGIPCTYTRDVIASVTSDTDDDVVMPEDVVSGIVDQMIESPIFAPGEVHDYESMADQITQYVREEQISDVLDALMRGHGVDDEEIEEYIEHVFSWGTDEETVDPDPVKMEVFEKRHLGLFDDSHYGLDTESDVSQQVEDFRRESVIQEASSYFYEHHDEYTIDLDDVPISEIPELQDRLDTYTWDDVFRTFENLEPRDWESPIEGTQTEEVKKETVQDMVDMFDYSETSARKTSEVVMGLVAEQYPDDDTKNDRTMDELIAEAAYTGGVHGPT